jgi:hypothetical protein
MLGKRIFMIAAILVWLLPGLAYAQDETLQLTATGATASQATPLIAKLPNAVGIVVTVDVTGGAGLLIDMNIKYYSDLDQAYYFWSIDCPSTSGITGTGTYHCAFLSEGISTGGHYAIDDRIVMLPQAFQIFIQHNNATAATYTVRTQWVLR